MASDSLSSDDNGSRYSQATKEIPMNTTTYAIVWAHVGSPTPFSRHVEPGCETYDEAVETVRATLEGAEIGHSGDIKDGGPRTLFWASAEDAENDDGARAAGYIVARPASE